MVTDSIRRERVTWIRWDPALRRNRISHPYQWIWTDVEGVERYYDTKVRARTAMKEAADA